MIGVGASLLALGVATAQDERRTPEDILAAAPADEWQSIDPENILVMDLPSGPMLIELRPDLAPQHVERMKTLTRQGFYDGIAFHRVIEGFVAQGGDPTGTGQGGSDLPDLAGEFAQSAGDATTAHMIGRDDRAAQVGFMGTVPVATQPPTLSGLLARDTYALWGLHCQGVLSMARAQSPNSANSQFFVLFGDSRDGLDQGYTVWGKVVDGYRNARRINRGEPPPRPTPIVRMRVLADMPQDEQVRVEHLRTDTATFSDYLKARGQMTEDGYVPDMCGIDVPIRINGEVTE
jgi:peptidylprolyl isomerase